MKRILCIALLAACSGKPAPTTTKPVEPIENEPEPPKSYAVAVPTTDPLPDFDHLWAKLLTDDYAVFVFDDGMVEWHGNIGMKSTGSRHARLPAETFAALGDAFDTAGFLQMEYFELADDCEVSTVFLSRYGGETEDGERIENEIEYAPCPASATLDTLLDQFETLIGVDQFIHNNTIAPGGALPDGDHALVYYHRGICYGSCPVFALTIYDDGTVVWDGQAYVEQERVLRAALSAATLQALIDAFDQARFMELDSTGQIITPCPPDQYCAYSHVSCTDTSHTITTYQRDGKLHTTNNAHCSSEGPNPLEALEDRIEELVIGDEAWIKTPHESIRLEAKDWVASLSSNRHLRWTGAAGDHEAWVPWSNLYAIDAALEEAAYFTMKVEPKKTKKKCGPRYKLTIHWGDDERTVDDDGCGSLPALRTLEQTIVDQLGLAAWIGK